MGPVAYAINLFTMRLQMVVMPIDLRDLSRTVVARTTSVHLHILMEFDEFERNKKKKYISTRRYRKRTKQPTDGKTSTGKINWNQFKQIS